jgi:SNF2 family DNA or RNA helicase
MQLKTSQLDHQREHFEAHARKAAFAILWEQGTGKTKEAIDEIALLIDEGAVEAVVVVAPNGVHRNWVSDELPKHMPDHIMSRLKTHIWQTQKAETKWHQRAVERVLGTDGVPMLLFSYDGFMTKRGKKAAWKLLSSRKCLYILDEAHRIKTPGALKTKSILASSKYAPYRRILTGTPVAKGPFDLYTQLKFIDEHIWDEIGCKNFQAYKTYFGIWEKKHNHKTGRDYPVLLQYRNIEVLNRIIDKVSSRVLKEDVLDLPPKLYTSRYYEMTSQQEQIYERLKQEFMYDHGNGKITNASLAIVRLLRFQQVLCGYLPFEDEAGNTGVEMIPGGNPRMDLLHETIEDLPHQAIVWARFTKDIDIICDRIKGDGKKVSRYDGSMDDDKLERSKLAFNKGETDYFVGNQAKGSEGLTLIGAKSAFYYNNTFNFIQRLQSEDRCHRMGQDGAMHEGHGLGVLYTDLICQDSVDEHYIANLLAKQDIASQITGDRLKEWLKL